jgi:hypothetical protein
VHGDVGMMSGIIVHQRHKQAGYVEEAKQRKKENISTPGKNRSIQTKEFAGKVKAFLLQ